MSISNILNILKHCDLSYLGYNNYNRIKDELPENFEYSLFRGASKLVIAPAYSPYVIKIPFRMSEEGEEHMNANSDDYYYWDYCLTEAIFYKLAKEHKIHYAFAKTKCIGENIDKVRVYIQEKAIVYRDNWSESSDFSIKTKSPDTNAIISTKDAILRSNDIKRLKTPEQWLVDALEYYGEKKFNQIISFIKQADIYSDLHSGNVGYIHGKPVIFDYSGYAE